jgi:N-acetylneuraminic acid mutarotase
MKLSDAIAQAESEFIVAFDYALPVTNVESFSALSIYNASGANKSGNAYLLALSTAFYKYASLKAAEFGTAPDAELTLVLNVIANDLADDGQIQTPHFLDEFVTAVRSLDPQGIIANLRQRSIVDYPSGLDVPDISVFLSLCAGTPQCAWRAGAPMLKPVRSAASAVHDGKIYVFGGTSPENTTVNLVQEYDPAKNQWTMKAPMPVASFDVAAHTIGDRIYVLAAYGAGGFMNQFMSYDPVLNQWETKAPKPTYRYEFASAVVAGRIYVLGGQGTIDNGPWASGKPWAFKDLVEIYDPASNSWSSGQPAPMLFSSATSCTANGDIHVFDGTTGANSTLQSSALIFHPGSNAWSTGSPTQQAKVAGSNCVSAGGNFYILGGTSSEGSAANSVRRYDPVGNTWTSPTRLPSSRYWSAAAAVGNELFIFGGVGGNGAILGSTEIFNTATSGP